MRLLILKKRNDEHSSPHSHASNGKCKRTSRVHKKNHFELLQMIESVSYTPRTILYKINMG